MDEFCEVTDYTVLADTAALLSNYVDHKSKKMTNQNKEFCFFMNIREKSYCSSPEEPSIEVLREVSDDQSGDNALTFPGIILLYQYEK